MYIYLCACLFLKVCNSSRMVKMSVREKYHFKLGIFLSERIKDTLCIVRRVYHCGISCGADYYITIGCKLS